MTPDLAETLLRGHEDLGFAATAVQRETIRHALQALANTADYLIFGVCADSQLAGLAALKGYVHHFGYDLTDALAQPFSQISGAVYLKFNPRSQRFLMDGYTGAYRGVLVSFQSDIAQGYSGTHGHFPLDLFVGQ
jgi:Domain of unknown function (DUF1824)